MAAPALPDGRYEADLENVTVLPVPRRQRYFLVLECVTDDAVRLTARQVEAAHFSFPELAPEEAEVEYARNLRKLENEDRLGTKH